MYKLGKDERADGFQTNMYTDITKILKDDATMQVGCAQKQL